MAAALLDSRASTPYSSTPSRDSSLEADSSSQQLTQDDQQQKKRRMRVKTGCVTCRIRRIKCDEDRPFCKRCTSTGRKCDGYLSLPMSRRDLPVAIQGRRSMLLSCHQVSSVSGLTDSTELLYFDFFRRKTTAGTNQYLSSDFWGKLVLQLCHSEPSIKHAVLAISALHQQWDLYGSSSYEVDRNAIAQYNKAIGSAKKMLTKTQSGEKASRDEIERVLVACVLFICFENLIGDYGASSLHLANGLQILAKDGNALSARGQSQRLQMEIVELLHRFDFQAMTFAQTRFPMRIASIRFQNGRPADMPERFENMSEARTYLFEQINWALCVGEVMGLSMVGIPQHPTKDSTTVFAESSAERLRCLDNLQLMWQQVEDMIGRQQVSSFTDLRASASYGFLKVHYLIAWIVTDAGCEGLETAWDTCMPIFEELIDILEILQREPSTGRTPLSLEVGICVPLWLIAYKCRDPVLRRKAIAILDAGQRKEGIWESEAAARVAERMMQIEEHAAKELARRNAPNALNFEPPVLLSAADIPEEARIQLVWTAVSMAERKVKIRCSLRKPGETGLIEAEDQWKVVNECVEF